LILFQETKTACKESAAMISVGTVIKSLLVGEVQAIRHKHRTLKEIKFAQQEQYCFIFLTEVSFIL